MSSPQSRDRGRDRRSRRTVASAGAGLAIVAAVTVILVVALTGGGSSANAASPPGLRKIKHIVVLYLENWSFDSLYGQFPGAAGLAQAASAPRQLDAQGHPYATLPRPLASAPGAKPTNPAVAENSAVAKPAAVRPPDARFPANLPNAPFPIFQYVTPVGKTAGQPEREAAA